MKFTNVQMNHEAFRSAFGAEHGLVAVIMLLAYPLMFVVALCCDGWAWFQALRVKP